MNSEKPEYVTLKERWKKDIPKAITTGYSYTSPEDEKRSEEIFTKILRENGQIGEDEEVNGDKIVKVKNGDE